MTTKREFKSMSKTSILALLKSKFEDPDGEFDEMGKTDLIKFGLANWDVIDPPETMAVVTGPVFTDLRSGTRVHTDTKPPASLDLG